MKRLQFLLVILLCFALQPVFSQNQVTFYANSNYQGYHKQYNAHGSMKVSNGWKWNSWKTNCCILFKVYTKYGGSAEMKLCGDVRDFEAAMKKWKNLKYGYTQLWRNVKEIRFHCDEKKYASKNNTHYNNSPNNNHNNGKYNNRNNNRNNHNNYSNGHKGNNNYNDKKDYSKYKWYKYYGKGNVIFTSDYHYEGQYKARASGSLDYRSLRFYPKSVLVAKSGRYLIVEYRDHMKRRQSFKLKEDVPDLRTYMASNLKLGDEHNKEPYKAITKFTIMRY